MLINPVDLCEQNARTLNILTSDSHNRETLWNVAKDETREKKSTHNETGVFNNHWLEGDA